MRTLYLAPPHSHPSRLAAYTFLDEEIRGLAQAGHDVFTVTLTATSPEVGPDNVHPLRVRAGSLAERMEAAFAVATTLGIRPPSWRHARERLHAARIEYSLAHQVQSLNLDVVHSHFGWPGGWGGSLLARRARLPLVATMRGMDLQFDRSLDYGQRLDSGYEAALRYLLQHADVTTYASRVMQARGVELGADPSRAQIVWKGVDLERFSPAVDREAAKAELGIRGDCILTVAGLTPLKGIDVVLRALSGLTNRDFSYMICGTGPERASLEELAESLGMADRVRFTGRVPRSEIPRFFAACDIFVLASRLEAAGNVILEAMASGRPVIATDSGGPRDYVVDGETGFIVPVDDAAALRGRIRQLLDERAVSHEMGRAGRERAEARHGYQRMIDRFSDVYERAISHHASAPGRRAL